MLTNKCLKIGPGNIYQVEATLKENGVSVVYLPRTLEISTTQIKKDLNGVK